MRSPLYGASVLKTNATGAFFNSFIAAVANLANKIAGAAGAAPKLAATQYRL